MQLVAIVDYSEKIVLSVDQIFPHRQLRDKEIPGAYSAICLTKQTQHLNHRIRYQKQLMDTGNR